MATDRMNAPARIATALAALAACVAAAALQPPPDALPGGPGGFDGPDGFDGPGGPPGRPGMRGPGGPGGPNQPERKLLARFDADGNGRLEGRELDVARAALRAEQVRPAGPRGDAPDPPAAERPADGSGRPDRRASERRGDGPRGPEPRGPGGPGGPGGMRVAPATPGPKVAPADVEPAGDAPLFAPEVVRTVFLDFPTDGWEQDLELFQNSDVDLPATMTVDGTRHEGVGVRFRGASSYFMVPSGSKRSLNVSVDHTDPDLRLLGQNTLNFLNANGDPSMMSTYLYSRLAAPHVPAPRANWVRVVINGESWGIYVNVEQFNKAFLKDRWPRFKGEGARWKVLGSPTATGGLDYRGEDLAPYRQRYELKTKERAEDWAALVALCRELCEGPLGTLEERLAPILDLEGTLWFLALDAATANSDGYWTRASDYSIYRDPEGRFHVVPHDMNEAFKVRAHGPGGPGGRSGGAPGGPGGGRAPQSPMTELDPLVAVDDPAKPLRSRLLAVPALRERYMSNLRTLAAEMAWVRTGPALAAARATIEPFVRADTRKLATTRAFEDMTSPAAPREGAGGLDTLRSFLEARSRFLLAPGNKEASR
jgi:hypothetical protein